MPRWLPSSGDGINRPSGKDLPGANSNVSLAPTVATYQSSSGSDNDNDQYDESSTGLRQDEVDQDPEQWPTPEYYQQSGQTHVGDNGATGANGGEQDRYNYTSLESGSRTGSNASFAGGNFIENFSDDDAGEEEKQDKAKNSAGDERMSPLTAGFGDDGMRGEEGWLTRNVRIRLPSKGEMLIYGGFLLNVSTKGTIACFETLGAEYAMTRFGLTSAEVGQRCALIYVGIDMAMGAGRHTCSWCLTFRDLLFVGRAIVGPRLLLFNDSKHHDSTGLPN